MDTSQLYIERLEQAVRVMEGLSETERINFDIEVTAVQTDRGIRACIAGFCGLDPWFQARGLSTIVDDRDSGSIGDLTVGFAEFFGTSTPFLRSRYPVEFADGRRDVAVSDAVAALKRSIDLFKCKHEHESVCLVE